jgi:hypothetical protein
MVTKVKRTFKYSIGAILVIFLAACGLGEQNHTTKARDTNDSANIVTVKTSVEAIKTDKGIQFEIEFENNTDQDIELTFNSGKQYEVEVEDESGKQLYLSSEGKMFTQAIQTVTVKAGEKQTWTDIWEADIESGNYNVDAKITASEVQPSSISTSELEAANQFSIE